MPQALLAVYLHIIFAARDHAEIIPKQHLGEVYAYIAGALKGNGCRPIIVGGTASHVHVLCELSNTITLGDLVKSLKGQTSLWIKEAFPGNGLFSWQKGYAAFSVSKSAVERVKGYIANQAEHHRRFTSRAEYVEFLRRHGVEYEGRDV